LSAIHPLQSGVEGCIVLKCEVVCCSVLQCVAVCCVLQCVAAILLEGGVECDPSVAEWCRGLYCVAV